MVPFLTIDHIHVVHSGGEVLKDISLRVNEGEHWALTGLSGSGKTTLLEAIAGKHGVRGGAIRHHYYERYLQEHPVNDPHFNYRNLLAEVSHQHHFRNRSNMQEFYYQQRFNSADSEEARSVRDYLGDENPLSAEELSIVRELQLEHLLDRSLIMLSNGETRRLMFAAALVKRPRLLLLDAPFTGLDAAARPYFHQLINGLAASGITIIMATREVEIPECVTHVAHLRRGRLTGTWERGEFEEIVQTAYEHDQEPAEANNQGSATEKRISATRKLLANLFDGPEPEPFEVAVGMREVSVRYGDVQVLGKINWTVKRGDRWALSGPNGAGKSTLLSLINADNPQAYANDIVLFDRQRGSGESIWEIKKKIGYVSPELHQYFRTADTCLQVVLSGLFDTLGLIRKVTSSQEEQAFAWLLLLGLQHHSDNPFRSSSLSVQRLTLIARALIKRPPLLILDEPCQGMDTTQIQTIRDLVDAVCGIAATTLIYVSHYADEIPSSVDQLLKLENGKVAYNGPRDGAP